jgi:hypothetical protein
MVIFEHFDMPDLRNRRDEYISNIPGAFGLEQPQLRTGHYSPEDSPDEVAMAVIRFLDDVYMPRIFQPVVYATFSESSEGFVCEGDSCSYAVAEEAIKVSPAAAPLSGVVQERPMDLTGATEMKIAFRYLPQNMKPGEALLVELWDGAEWIDLLTLKCGDKPGDGDFSNQSTDYGYVRISRDQIRFAATARVRFSCRGDSRNSAIFLKEVGIYTRDQH